MAAMRRARRLRGRLLRLVSNRPAAIAAGAGLAAPALMLLFDDYAWETGVTDGLTLVALATGAALVWTGIAGRRPDWYDE